MQYITKGRLNREIYTSGVVKKPKLIKSFDTFKKANEYATKMLEDVYGTDVCYSLYLFKEIEDEYAHLDRKEIIKNFTFFDPSTLNMVEDEYMTYYAKVVNKRINEMAQTQKFGKRVEYIIRYCDVYIAEDNYEQGELDSTTVEYDCSRIKSDTLLGLMQAFNEEHCQGHKFNIDDWVYDPDRGDRLELSITSKFANDYALFEEPTPQDLERFKKGKTNLSSFIFNLYIERHEINNDLNDEFRRIGIDEM